MKKTIRVTESQLKQVISKILNEQFTNPFPTTGAQNTPPLASPNPAPKQNAPQSKPAPQAFSDPSWAKETQAPLKSEFPACILNYGKPETGLFGPNVRYIKFKMPFAGQLPTIYAYNNGRCGIYDGTFKGKMGSYTCSQDGKRVIITLDNKQTIAPLPQQVQVQTQTVAPTIPSVQAGTGLIKYGMTGDAVKHIQTLLLKRGYTNVGTPDGRFGKLTLDAVKQFQTANKLKVDGIVGKNTLSSLLMVNRDQSLSKVNSTISQPQTIPTNSTTNKIS